MGFILTFSYMYIMYFSIHLKLPSHSFQCVCINEFSESYFFQLLLLPSPPPPLPLPSPPPPPPPLPPPPPSLLPYLLLSIETEWIYIIQVGASCPETLHVDQGGLGFTAIFLPLPSLQLQARPPCKAPDLWYVELSTHFFPKVSPVPHLSSLSH